MDTRLCAIDMSTGANRGSEVVVESRTKTFLVVLSFLVLSLLPAYLHAEPNNLEAAADEADHSMALPSKDRMTLVSFLPVVLEGNILGGLATYDDLTTNRRADYLELFNNDGTLVVVGWFDRFGIERVAVDRALLEDADQLEGVFVLLLDGESV
jgi:hypothetical protein